MIGCHDCFGSVGLRNVRYYFFNEKCSKEQYEEKLKQYSFASQKNLAALYQQFYRNFVVKLPIRNDVIINSEACSGNYIQESKDVHYSFDVEKTDTGRDSWGVEYSKDVYRCDFVYYAENCYENISNSKSHNIVLSFCALNGCYDLTYCMLAFNNSHDSFGCLSLKHNQYCILNKQYSEKEYKDLVEKLVNHMKKTGEWGQFFPPALSLFAYNETPSQEYFPLSRAEVAHFGAAWKEDDQKEYLPQTYLVPDFVDEVEDDILSAILACSDCSKNYRLIERELDFYRSNQISVPTKCPYCRHLDRLKLRNPKKLWSRYGKYPVF